MRLAGTRLRKGPTNSTCGAVRLLAAARRAGVPGLVITRTAGALAGDRHPRTRISPVRAQ